MLTLPEYNILQIDENCKECFQIAAQKMPLFEEREMRKLETQNAILEQMMSLTDGKFAEVVSSMRDKIQKRPYFVLIRGLEIEDQVNLLIALSRCLGEVVEPYNKPWSRLIHPLKPSSDWKGDETDTLSEKLHTDGTSWIFPNDYTGLVCVKPDQFGGGRTRLIDICTLVDDFVSFHNQEIFKKCCDHPMPWNIATELGGGIHWSPIFINFEIRWMEYTIFQAVEKENLHLTDIQHSVLAAMNDFLMHCENFYDFLLEKGDYLIFDNKRTLHARTPFNNPLLSNRHYYRVKISRVPNNR